MGAFGQWWRARRRETAEDATATHRFDAEFATIFANAAIGITVTDGVGGFLRTNPAFDRFLGYGPGELVGTQVRSVVHPDDWAADVALFKQLRRGERDSYQIEKRYVRKDGTVVWGRLVVSAVRGGETSIVGIGMVEDITEQRRIKEQLDLSRTRLREVNRQLKLYLDSAPLACIAWDPEHIVRVWNAAAERMFGYAAAEALGSNVYKLTATPAGLAVVDQVRAQIQAGGEYRDGIVIENRRKDGSRLHCHWHFTIVNSSPEFVGGVVAFAIDVTARVRAEEARELLEASLRHAQKMQSLGTLAGGIAHDFNNILLAICGNTKLAAQDLPADHPAQVSLAEVGKASARASDLVNQILAFSRREESAHAPLDLRTVLEESLSLIRAALPSNVSLRTCIVPAAPIVLGDPSQMHQIVLHLATNAAYAMGDAGGVLDVDLEEIKVDEAIANQSAHLQPGRYYRIGVRDTGVGMQQDQIERIFEPFFTTKPRGQGTGLGLSVVHGIVKAHCGAIVVSSAPGKGSTFHVYLPVQGETPATATPTVQRGQGQSILYVDDEEPLVYLITRVLERLGYRVAGFTDAHAALAAFQTDPSAYEAVVTDLSMPGMSGAEFAKQILQIRPQLPVVMTSGYVPTEDRESVLRTGVRELLLKPNTVEELGEVLHRLLREVRGVTE